MNIYAEFERLRQFIAEPGGWGRIDRLWMQGMGYVEVDGEFVKKGYSLGSSCTGIAIDPVTWEVVIGPKGFDHSRAHGELVNKILKTENALKDHEVDIDHIEFRVQKAYLIEAPGWKFPFIMINDWHKLGMKNLKLTEEKMLELNLGLPLCRLFVEKNPEHLEIVRRMSGDPT